MPFVHTPAAEADGLFSPDGRWMAYTSNESGKREVYITSFPQHQGKWQISNGGGVSPLWSANGKELFFSNGTSVMGVDVRPTTTFDFSVPRKVCEAPLGVVVQDISADGKQFLVTASQPQRLEFPRIEVVTRWFDLVKSKFAGNKD
jgi:Tol biopolymer transport system component